MMMKLAIATISLLAAAATADANPTIYNATSETLSVEATYPNGKVEKRKLGDGSWGNSSLGFIVGPGVDKLEIKIYDDVGGAVWSGSSGPNDVHVVLPDGDKTKTIFAGHYSGGSDTPKAAMFLNVSGEPITVDLEGMNGVGAHRDIKPGGSFDPKQLLRLDPRETTFKVTIKGKEEVKLSMKVVPGRHYVISKHPREKYRLLQLGYLPPPKKSK